MDDREVLKEIIRKKDVKFLVKHKFGYDLTPGQEDIVRKVAFREHKRINISAMTRYGKTLCVAIGISLLIDMTGEPVKVAFIGPKEEQAGLLRQYMAELILKDPSLLGKAQINVTGSLKIMKEASRKRMTFTTGAEYRVFSAEGDADRLMGFGADIVITDEACLINRVAYTKILRMLGDNPEQGMLVELYNPWNRDNVAFDHTQDDNFYHVRIGWEQAVKEGRTTREFVMEQKKQLTPMEFDVLYESRFPSQSEDSLFSMDWIDKAVKADFQFI
jgi:hypothetical protein